MASHTNRLQRASDDPVRAVLDAFRRIGQAIRQASRSSELHVGISAAQLFVLSKLSSGRAMSLNELADRTLTHQSSASVVVSRLVNRGLVQRVRSRHDGRRQELSLTPSGRALLRKAPGVAQDKLVAVIRKMSGKDLKQLAGLLQRLVDGLGISDTTPAPMFDDSSRDGRLAKPTRGKNIRPPVR